MNIPPYCDNCKKFSVKKKSFFGWFWSCPDCRASVGCHKGTDAPLGTLAGKELKELRRKAHGDFDRLWIDGIIESRTIAYRWLAKVLVKSKANAHIGMLDERECLALIEACDKYVREFKTGVEQSAEVGIWTGEDGIAIHVSEMSEEHLSSEIERLTSNQETVTGDIIWLNRFKNEYEQRGKADG